MGSIELGLLGSSDRTTSSTANPLARAQPAAAGGPPPSLAHIEERGVSAAFLRHITAAQLGDEQLAREASEAAAAFLKNKIEQVEAEIAKACAFASERRREAAAIGTGQPEPEPEAEPEAGPEPETETETEPECVLEPEPKLSAEPQRYYLSRGLSRGLSRARSSAASSVEADPAAAARSAAEEAERVVRVLNRALRTHKRGLRRRQDEPYLTARDVHRHLVAAATGERMCRYVELPGVGDGTDPETGQWFVGRAQFFFSYSWDSAWEEVVSALADHSARWTAQEQRVAQEEGREARPPPYYWIDIFAVNQHTSLPPWKCEMGLANCPGCAAVAADMHDWATDDWRNPKGFARVISHTQHTLVLNDHWSDPRPPTRVWCLFEGYQTLERGGTLEVVLGEMQRLDLQLSLSTRFAEVEAVVEGIDSRMAEATVAADQEKIFGAIESLPGGFDGLNAKMRTAQRRWLAAAAAGVLTRTDPYRPPLSEAELAGAKTRLLERWPRLPYLLGWLGRSCVAPILVHLCWLYGAIIWQDIHSDSDGGGETIGALCALAILGAVLLVTSSLLEKHQVQRQLRRPPLLGARAFQQRRAITAAAVLAGCLGAPLAASLALGEPAEGLDEYFVIATRLVFVLLPLILGGFIAQAIFAVVAEPGVVTDRRARLCAQVGWLWLALGEAGKAAEILGTAHAERLQVAGTDEAGKSDWTVFRFAHEGSYGAAPGYARALCEAGRREEAEELVRQVEAAAKRNAASWRRFLRLSKRIAGAVSILVGAVVGLASSSSVGAAVSIALFLALLMLNDNPPRAVGWKEQGALLRARMAAAVGAPDAEVLELLEEAGQTEWGQKQVLNTNQPELAAFLERMKRDEALVRRVEQAQWESLPPVMRSAGDNPLSAWIKYTCEGRAYYKRGDPEQLYGVYITSLDAPSEGVKQVAEMGMVGLTMLGETKWRGWLRLSHQDIWESTYADLGGPECWSEQRNRRYKLAIKAKKAGWALFFLGILVVLFCWAFVYVDCGDHGSLGIGSCTCNDNFSGDRCDLCRCIDGCPCPARPVSMAEAYIIAGAGDSKYDGRYERRAAKCSGKPVYQLGGQYSYVLFQPTNQSYWIVGSSGHGTSCANDGYIRSNGNGGECPVSPDGGGCAGRWQEFDGSAWQDAPAIVVDRWCPALNPCCGMDCGAHGDLVGNSTEACVCRCADGYSGDRCQLAPLPPLPAGMAEAYIIAGAGDSKYDGRYERRAAKCSGKPVYQLGGQYSYVLFQPTNQSYWIVGSSGHSTSCANDGYIRSNGNGGECPLSPDGGGCAGRWQEWDGGAWRGAPGIVVSRF
jgi:hypothetical protein